jgi:AraC family transcriptional regulator, transcriptional activator of pobA
MTEPSRAGRASDPSPRARAAIPSFALYGEAPSPAQERLHIETIQSRSRLYQWEIRPHVHQGLCQILWVRQGRAKVTLDEVSEAVEGPAAIATPPGVVHGYQFSPGTDGLVLTLSVRFLVEGEPPSAREAFKTLFLKPSITRLPADTPAADRLDRLFRELAAEFATPGGGEHPVLIWLARAIVWRLTRARVQVGGVERQNSRHQALFSRFLLLVEEHVLDRWPLKAYARALGLTTQRLNRIARSESGRSGLEIVHERLTREACRRLFYIAAPAEKLAIELGFDDPAYFSRFFKRRTGLTPRRWRESQRAAP